MAGWILNSRAASAAVLSPLVTMRLTSACCCGDSFGRRPPMRPSRRADSKPAFALSRSMARSSSATVRSSVAHEDVDVHVDKTGQQRDIVEIDDGGAWRRTRRIDGLMPLVTTRTAGETTRDRLARRACAARAVRWSGREQ